MTPPSPPPPFRPNELFEVFPVLWFLFDPSDHYRDYRAPNRSHLYLAPEVFLGRRADAPFTAEIGAATLRALAEARRTLKPVLLEYTLTLIDGARDFEARFLAREDGWVSCFVSDTSVQKRFERRLVERERRFRRLVAAGWDVIVLTDASGRILDVSPSVTRVLGWREEDVIGHNAMEIVHPDDLDEATHAHVRAAANPAQPITVVMRNRHRRGDWRWIESSITSHLDDPHLGCLVINCRDVTDRKNLEERLRAAQRLEELGRLAGGIAHDFNNLLTIILGYSEALAADATLRGDRESAEDLREVVAAGKRGRELTRRLLAFARRQVLTPQNFDLNNQIRELRVMLARLLDSGIDLVLDLCDEPAGVRADPGQLEQILLNLAVNARDAMPDGGEFRVETAVEGHHVVLRISDSGFGIGPEILPQIFEPFFTTKPSGQGTGLGLPTVHSIVTQLGGSISVDSRVGRGTRFELRIPAAALDDDERPVRSGPVSPELRTGLRVLVVEDEEAVRAMVVKALRQAGHEVIDADDGSAALVLALESVHPFDVVVSDVSLPGLSGPSLVAAVRARHPDIGILLISGYTADHVVNDALDAPRTLFLAKPVTPAALRDAVFALATTA